MKIRLPEPFFFEEGKRAVLLLHGFTGNSSDVRQLGRFLQKKVIQVMHRTMKVTGYPRKNCLHLVPTYGGAKS